MTHRPLKSDQAYGDPSASTALGQYSLAIALGRSAADNVQQCRASLWFRFDRAQVCEEHLDLPSLIAHSSALIGFACCGDAPGGGRPCAIPACLRARSRARVARPRRSTREACSSCVTAASRSHRGGDQRQRWIFTPQLVPPVSCSPTAAQLSARLRSDGGSLRPPRRRRAGVGAGSRPIS